MYQKEGKTIQTLHSPQEEKGSEQNKGWTSQNQRPIQSHMVVSGLLDDSLSHDIFENNLIREMSVLLAVARCDVGINHNVMIT